MSIIKKITILTAILFLIPIKVLALNSMILENSLVVSSIIAFFVKICFAIWVYYKNPYAKVNKYFCLLFLSQAIWDIGKGIMWVLNDQDLALIFARISYTGYIISIFLFLQFIWAYLKKKNFFTTTSGKQLLYAICIAFVILLWFSPLIINKIVPTPLTSESIYPFWDYKYGEVYNYFFMWFQIIPFVYGLFMLTLRYFSNIMPDQKKQVLYVIIGSSFPIVIGIPTGVILPAIGVNILPQNSILTLIMCLFFTIGIIKHKFLSIEPLGEKSSPSKLSKEILKEYELEYSNSYFITSEKSTEMSYKILLNYLTKEHFGLVITTKHPEKVRIEHQLETTPIIWMTDSETEHVSLDPVDIEQLYQTISKFSKKVKQPFILLDCFDYLLQHNNFNKMLHFLIEIKKTIEQSGGVLLIPKGNLQLDPKEEMILNDELTILPLSKSKMIMLKSNESGSEKRFRKFRHIILGYTPVTESLLLELGKMDIKPSIITAEKLKSHVFSKNVTIIQGDPLSKNILLEAKISRPNTLIIITMKEDSEVILAINKIRQITENAMVVANIDNEEFIPIAIKAGANHIIPSSNIGGRLLTLTLCAPNAVKWVMDATTMSSKDIELVDINVGKNDFIKNKTVKKVDDILNRKAIIIAVMNEDGLQKIPDDDYILKQGDQLVMVVNLSLIGKKKLDEVCKAIKSGKI